MALAPWVTPIAYCEVDAFAQRALLSGMLRNNWPAAPIWDDVRTLDGRPFRGAVDIIYGGFPCQDLSVAGLKKGLDGGRSGLFFEISRLAKEIKPSFIFLENVPGIRQTGPVSIVIQELAACGFVCRWDVISAGEVGCQFQGDRWFLLGSTFGARLQKSRRKSKPKSKQREQKRDAIECPFQREIRIDRDPELHRIFDGVSPKTHRVRALGNSVVPLQAREAFQRLAGLK